MPMHLITGHAETAHISAADAGALNAASIGAGSYVFEYGDNLAATMTTANKVTIGTGALIHQGRQALVDAPVELTVESGTQAQKRIDLVVARYTKSGDIDDMQLAVVKGTPVSYGEPSAPEIEEGSILEGATASDMPLWSIEIDGITPGDPVQLFETVPSIDALRDSVSHREDQYGWDIVEIGGAKICAYSYDLALFAEGNEYARFTEVPLPNGLFTYAPHVIAGKRQTGNSSVEVAVNMNVANVSKDSVRVSINNSGGGIPENIRMPFVLFALGW